MRADFGLGETPPSEAIISAIDVADDRTSTQTTPRSLMQRLRTDAASTASTSRSHVTQCDKRHGISGGGQIMPRSLISQLRSRFGKPIDPVTRREVLQGSIAVGMALLLSGPRAFARPPKPSGKSIIVIGAGFGETRRGS